MVKILIKSSLDLFYSQHTDARYWYSNSVRPSACPSVRYVPVSDENGLTYCHSFFSPHGSPVILVLSALNVFTKFRRGHPCVGAKYRWGIKILRFSTNKSLYLPNDTRYSHSYYGRRIGTRMRSIRWCHFHWPWTNPNPVFKVTPLFDAKYLTNGTRYGHSYYRKRIGNRTQALNDLEWPLSQILRSPYYSTSNTSQMVQDRAIVTMAD